MSTEQVLEPLLILVGGSSDTLCLPEKFRSSNPRRVGLEIAVEIPCTQKIVPYWYIAKTLIKCRPD